MTVYVVLERQCIVDEYGEHRQIYEFSGLVYSTLQKAYKWVKDACKYFDPRLITSGEKEYEKFKEGSDKSYFDYGFYRIVKSDVNSGNDRYGVYEL